MHAPAFRLSLPAPLAPAPAEPPGAAVSISSPLAADDDGSGMESDGWDEEDGEGAGRGPQGAWTLITLLAGAPPPPLSSPHRGPTDLVLPSGSRPIAAKGFRSNTAVVGA